MAVPIIDEDQTVTTVHLKDFYQDQNGINDFDDTNEMPTAELEVLTEKSRFNEHKKTKGHDVILLYIALTCVLTVLKQWIHDNTIKTEDLLSAYHKPKINDKIQIQLATKEDLKAKEFLHRLVKTFQCIPRQLVDIFMLHPQEYNKYIDEKTELASSMNDSMLFEWSRLSSFSNYPNLNISVIRLAEAGFFYQGNGDEVICYFCELKHKNWNSCDNPRTLHIELSSNCPFVTKNLKSKLPNSEDRVTPLLEKERVTQSSGACGSQTERTVMPRETSEMNSNETCTNNGINTLSGAETGSLPVPANVNHRKEGHVPVAIQSTKNSQNGNDTINVRGSEASLVGNEANKPMHEQQRSITHNSSGAMDLQTSNLTGSLQTFNNFSRNDTTGLIRIQNFDSSARHPNRPRQNVPSESTLSSTFNQNNMGICVEKPKYPKYAVRATRLSSFTNWALHLTQTPEDLSTAGFFYTGTEDHCRCFFCGGGLRRWEVGDLPWTEHARWYPKCPFVKQCKGEKFIDDVQNGRNTELSERENTEQQTVQSHGINGFTNNPAVQTILEFGYEMEMVKTAYQTLRRAGIEDITATLLLETLYEIADSNQHSEQSTVQNTNTENVPPSVSNDIGREDKKENMADVDPALELSIRSLEEENRNLKDQQTCKICLDEPVAIVFLPCGHMAACVNCAPALRRCPICRAFIKGTVKAIMC